MKKASVALILMASVVVVGMFALSGCTPEDLEAPVISGITITESPGALFSEVSGGIIKGEVLVVVTATDNVGVDSVVFFINDTSWVIGPVADTADEGTTDQYTYVWNTMAPPLEDSVSYSIGAKVYDYAGNVTVSDMLTYLIRIPNTPPDSLLILQPDDGDIITDAIQAVWWKASDPDTLPPQALLFDIYVDTGLGLELMAEDLPEIDDAEPAGDTFMTWSTGQITEFYIAPETEYSWELIAKDPYGQTLSSGVLSFSRGENDPPSPGAASPTEDSVRIIEYPEGGEVDLLWALVDPNEDPVTFDLYFGEDPGTDPVYLSDLDVEATDLQSSEYTVTVSAGKTYYWRPLGTDMWGLSRDPDSIRAWRIVVE